LRALRLIIFNVNDMNIRFTGFGGQGIVLSGVILGWAAILEGKNAIQTQSYGSEARGGSCKCDVIIENTEILELEPAQLDILIAFSQPAFEKYHSFLKPEGLLFIDKDLVNPADPRVLGENKNARPTKTFAISATDIAVKKMKHKIMANIVMLGYMTAKTGLISPESVEKSIERHVPAQTVEENLKAFRTGLTLI